jgi:hypothetical protein
VQGTQRIYMRWKGGHGKSECRGDEKPRAVEQGTKAAEEGSTEEATSEEEVGKESTELIKYQERSILSFSVCANVIISTSQP